MINRGCNRAGVLRRRRVRIAAVCAVWVVVLAGCSSEKYARYEPDENGRGPAISRTGEKILAGTAAVALAGAWMFFWFWYGHYSRGEGPCR